MPPNSSPKQPKSRAATVRDQRSTVETEVGHHLESLDRLADHLDTLEFWLRTKPGVRKPKLSHDLIAAAAVRIADAEGFEALSMRRLAAELDVGTMTIYHYVKTKDELLAVLFDTIAGEVVVPDDEAFPAEWKQAITMVARRSRAAVLRHPWVLDLNGHPPIGPNGTRHFDQSLLAVSGLGGTLEDRLDVITAVDEYVFGFCMFERAGAIRPTEAIDPNMLAHLERLVATGDYPQISALQADGGLPEAWDRVSEHSRDASRFDRNLGRLLAGIEADVRSRSAPTRARRKPS